jgi:hypothetical protein
MPHKTPARVHVRGPAALGVLAGVLLPVTLFLFGYAYLTQDRAVFNSDHLYCSAVCADVLAGRPLTGWHFPGAPYLFPDMALLLPCRALAPNLPGEFLAYNFLLYLSLGAAAAGLARAAGLGWRPALAAAGGGLLLFLATHLGPTYESRATHLASPGSHAAIIPLGLALLALAARALRRGQRPLPAAAFVVLGALGAFSDKLLVVQFLAPMAGACLLLACVRVVALRELAGHLGLTGAAYLLSLGLERALLRLGFHLLAVEGFQPPQRHDLPVLLGRLAEMVRDQYLLAALVPLYFAAALAVLWAWRRRPAAAEGAGPDRRAVLLVSWTLLLSPLATVAGLYAAGMARNPAVPRYALNCFVLPFLGLGLFLRLHPARWARGGGHLFGGLAVLVALVQAAAWVPRLDIGRLKTPYPPLARALDCLARERGLKRGLAGFWFARHLEMLSREGLVLHPVTRFGEPFFHAANSARFLADDPRDLRVPPLDFILVAPGRPSRAPTPEEVALQYGPPREKIPLGTEEVWLYDRPRSTALDRFFRSRLAERLRAERPFVGPASPACLAVPKANTTPSAAPGSVAVAPGEALEVRFAGPVSGALLDVGVGFMDRFDLDFYAGPERLGSLSVPGVPWNGRGYDDPGVQARLLPVPPAVRSRSWDRIVVRPRAGSPGLSLAHLLVFAEDVPDVGVGPAGPPPRVRLEAEALPTFADLADDMLASSTPEPGASGGRVRTAPAGFAGVLTFSIPLTLPPGRYRLDYAVRAAETPAGEVGRIDAMTFNPPAALAGRPLDGSEFPAPGAWGLCSLTLDLPEETDGVLFRLVTAGRTALALDYIDLTWEPAGSPSARGN